MWDRKLAPVEDRADGGKDSFYEGLEIVFYQFPIHHMHIFSEV
jgi:hypothetical protein